MARDWGLDGIGAWPVREDFMRLVCAALMISASLASYGGSVEMVDYAKGIHRDAWLGHPVYGGASFDSFERLPGNPVVRGKAPYEWPVNGSLFEDPVSGDWFLYVGYYCAGYAHHEGTASHCTVHRSRDRGATWEKIGPLFDGTPHVFEGETWPLRRAPDAVVTYADGRYHLCFDWATENNTWKNAHNPPPDANSGAGHAWSERPEGPFHISKRPILTTREQKALLGKYRRMYASSLIRREKDWLVLTLTDSGPYFGWALVGVVADTPEGPWSEAKLLLYPEKDGFHPPLLEFFPAFAHEGYVYAPTTSVAANRNFQVVFRVPIEKALDPAAWEIHQQGSVWHAEPVEYEHYGIWGQTLSGFVGKDGIFNVMFPSRDSQGMGTINLAARPWDQPHRERGFVVSGHEGPSMVRLKRHGRPERIEAVCDTRGTVTLAWDVRSPLAPDAPRSGAQPHALMLRNYRGLELKDTAWALVNVDAKGERTVFAEGPLPSGDQRAVSIAWESTDTSASMESRKSPLEGGPRGVSLPAAPEFVVLRIGEAEWRGKLPHGAGGFAVLAGPWSHAQFDKLAITAETAPAEVDYLYTEALLGAAQNLEHWEEVKDERFRHGIGAVSKQSHVEAKWNFEGDAFVLWAPKGPDYGKARILLDGTELAVIDFRSDTPQPSSAVLERHSLEGRYHALKLIPVEGHVPLDTLRVRLR